MKDKNLYAVILAGGAGTRFWPLSRKSMPKQFLSMTGKDSFLKETINRLRGTVPAKNFYIVTNKEYKNEIKKQTAGLGISRQNVLLEPQGKNTAPAVCWAAAKIYFRDPNAVIGVFPSDHLIKNKRNFLRSLNEAIALARRNYLVTFGIVPTRPETGYGYLQTMPKKSGNRTVTLVKRFTEKPSLKKAMEFIGWNPSTHPSGSLRMSPKKKNCRGLNYFWNSGMFVFKSETILGAYKKYLPQVYHLLSRNLNRVNKIWPKLPSISVDYGIMEKANNVVAVKAKDIGWSDVGSWEALAEVLPKDKTGNMFKGDVWAEGCRDTLVHSGKRFVAAVGLSGIVIVDTPDALLVCRKEKSQAVKDVVAHLKKTGRKEL